MYFYIYLNFRVDGKIFKLTCLQLLSVLPALPCIHVFIIVCAAAIATDPTHSYDHDPHYLRRASRRGERQRHYTPATAGSEWDALRQNCFSLLSWW